MSDLIYPIRYYYRAGVSDKDFILENMAKIPKSKQQQVADKYEKLFLQGGVSNTAVGRKQANDYLEKAANWCVERGALELAKLSANKDDSYQAHQKSMIEQERATRKEIKKPVNKPEYFNDKKTEYKGPSIIEMAEQSRKGK